LKKIRTRAYHNIKPVGEKMWRGKGPGTEKIRGTRKNQGGKRKGGGETKRIRERASKPPFESVKRAKTS